MRAPATIGAVESLYAGHGEWLVKWLERRLHCPDRAAEISHDTFCRLLERLPDVMPASPRGYLATIARRLLLDDVRRREIERAVIESQALHASTVDLLTPDRIVEAVRFLHDVLTALDALPAATRQVLLMRRVDGLGHQEIAAALGMSTRTVRRHIVAATVHIHALMAD